MLVSGRAGTYEFVRSPKSVTAMLAVVYLVSGLLAFGPAVARAEVVALAAVLAALLLWLSFVDLSELRLPDLLTGSLALVGLLVVPLVQEPDFGMRALAAIGGWAAMAGVAVLYERASGRPGLGLGDAKLVGSGGAWVGLEGLASVVLWGAGLGLLVVGVGTMCGRRSERGARIAFGPFLALGIWLVWLFGPLAV